ncbi:MAG: hypothetical protein AB2692_13815 [Candidatus Thiodiazotropha sp.]
MNPLYDTIISFVSSDWIYSLIFIVAIAEASVLTSFFLSGTIGLVVVGVLIAQGLLNPAFSILLVYAGTLIGDLSSYFLSSWLQRFSFIRSALNRLEPFRSPIGDTPFRFILSGHITPYVRVLLPIIAAGKVAPMTYILMDAVAALGSTIFFIGIGLVGAKAWGQIPPEHALNVAGILAITILVGIWIRSRKPFCPLKPGRQARWFNLRRAIIFYIWFLPWHPIRWIELWLRGSTTRKLRRELVASFPDVLPGDVFLIRLHVPAPWGRWAHSCIAIDTEKFVHGFSSVITAHSIASLPVRYAIAHIRPKCESEVALEAARVAESKIGVPVSIAAHRDEMKRFSCSTLVAHAYRQAGVELVDPAIARIVPNDLFESPHMQLVRIVNTENVSLQTRRYVFEAREEGGA